MKHILCIHAMCAMLLASEIDMRLAQECFKRYYPQIVKIEGNEVLLESGTSFIWDDGLEKNYDDMLLNPDFKDAFTYPYPLHGNVQDRHKDTSRVRHIGFLKAIYGDSAQAVNDKLVKVAWLKGAFEKDYILVSGANGVDKAFEKVVQRLAHLPEAYHHFLSNQDAFYWRNIADSPNLSPHSFGIALDINTHFSKYWLWDKKERDEYQYENQIPLEIVHAFEDEGFVWGGRWWHYDTMHFEYRPEIICYARRVGSGE